MSTFNAQGPFFGLFDPDGRPWQVAKLPAFQGVLESALKIAFLTQTRLVIPAGYFFDNLPLQQILLKYSGSDVESRSFAALMQNCVSISLNESNAFADAVPWHQIVNDWLCGSGSHRGVAPYLNCLPHKIANNLQSDKNNFISNMSTALLNRTGVDFQRVLSTLEALKLQPVSQAAFPFQDEITLGLLRRREHHQALRQQDLEKLQCIIEQCKSAGIRLSRSALQNSKLCYDLGVPQDMIFSRADYTRLANVFAHYHHLAFAKALGMDSFVSRSVPTIELRGRKAMLGALRAVEDNVQLQREKLPRMLLGHVSFEKIFGVRLGRKQTIFYDKVRALAEASRSGNSSAYRHAVHEHARHIAEEVSLAFSKTDPNQFLDRIGGAIFAPDNSVSQVGSTARLAFTFFRELIPNVRAEVQIRHCFRSLLIDGAEA